ESYGEKAWRKFKEEPLVPIGTCATIYALVMAAVKLNRRESRSFNYWLRARIAGQIFTVGAVYMYYQRREQDTAASQEKAGEQYTERERKEFEGRLKVA
ncbi:hypoxia induced protein conserved region-domain-containing protein, partial [Phlebopus sp. FC_14]